MKPHANADALELAEVLGWQVVVKKGEFKTGDLCVYVVVDTVLPEKPDFEFLRNKHFRIKPIRLRGEASNGICFPLSILPMFRKAEDVETSVFEKYNVGDDVSDILEIKHYEKPMPANLAGQAYGHLPGYLIMTDEDNLRSYPEALAELIGNEYYITRKDDGSSGTFFIKDGVFGVCSRRIHLKEDANNGFWRMAEKYNLEASIRGFFPSTEEVAIQGEVVGPGIQGNPLGLTELELHVFSIFHIQTRAYYPFVSIREFCNQVNVPMVSLVDMGDKFKYKLEDLISMANKLKYPNGKPAEGIVIRPQFPLFSTILNKPWSGKVISETYEEKS